jgi:hypothetical protein
MIPYAGGEGPSGEDGVEVRAVVLLSLGDTR